MNNNSTADNSIVPSKKSSKLSMLVFWCALIAGLFYFMSFLNGRETEKRIDQDKRAAEVNACVNRGISYFKDMGSYPNLKSDGRDAKRVAQERCERATTAF